MEQTLLKPIWKGQITIPWSWRKALWITKETFVKATLTANWVLLQNANINLSAEDDEKIFDDSIRNVFTDLWKSWELKKLSKILSEKY
jgi:bifunctional DNA-binding transcriptional regulator/antitoxin component of YhaV-PrlF toxin-antitoxin module